MRPENKKGGLCAFVSQKNRRSISGIVLLISQRIFQKSFGLISTYFLVRALTLEQFGTYSFVISVTSLMTIFGFIGLKNSIMQSVARGHLATYRNSLPLSFAGCLMGSFIMLMIAHFYQKSDQTALMYCFIIAAISLPFYEGLSQWRQISIGKENFKSFFKLETAWQFIMHASIIVVALLFPYNIPLVVLVFLGVPAILNTLITIRDLRGLKPNETTEPESIRYGLKTSFYAAFNTLAVQSDKLLLFMFMSPASVALFVAAERIPELMRNLVQDGIAVMAPRFARETNYNKDIDRTLKMSALILGIFIAAFSVTILPWLLILIFGEDYAEAVPYAQALALSVAVGNAATLRYRFIRSQLDSKSYAKITITTSVFRVMCSALLIPLFGIAGAITSAFAYRLIMSLSVDWTLRKYYLNGAIDNGK